MFTCLAEKCMFVQAVLDLEKLLNLEKALEKNILKFKNFEILNNK